MATEVVSLKLPAVWTDDIETWFVQVEAQFQIRKISDETTKFNHVVSALDYATASRVKSLIRNPPPKPYTALKVALQQKFLPTEYERAAAINAISSLGDQKPSQVMEKMLHLLGESSPGLMFRFHFLRILPDFVRNTLSLSKETDCERLAAEADRIFLIGRPSSSSTLDAIAEEHEDGHVDRVTSLSRRHKNKRAPRFNRTPAESDSHGLCFYHHRFGGEARRCTSPCTWRPGNAAQGQRQ